MRLCRVPLPAMAGLIGSELTEAVKLPPCHGLRLVQLQLGDLPYVEFNSEDLGSAWQGFLGVGQCLPIPSTVTCIRDGQPQPKDISMLIGDHIWPNWRQRYAHFALLEDPLLRDDPTVGAEAPARGPGEFDDVWDGDAVGAGGLESHAYYVGDAEGRVSFGGFGDAGVTVTLQESHHPDTVGEWTDHPTLTGLLAGAGNFSFEGSGVCAPYVRFTASSAGPLDQITLHVFKGRGRF